MAGSDTVQEQSLGAVAREEVWERAGIGATDDLGAVPTPEGDIVARGAAGLPDGDSAAGSVTEDGAVAEGAAGDRVTDRETEGAKCPGDKATVVGPMEMARNGCGGEQDCGGERRPWLLTDLCSGSSWHREDLCRGSSNVASSGLAGTEASLRALLPPSTSKVAGACAATGLQPCAGGPGGAAATAPSSGPCAGGSTTCETWERM